MNPSEPAYGFDDDAPTRRLLRSRPPTSALAWAGAALGGRVAAVRALRGGQSSAVHQLTVNRPDGRIERVVLRRYVRPELNLEEPDIAAREARALNFVDRLAVPTPRLLACELDGNVGGVPMLLMSRLPGRVDWQPSDMDRWLRRLVELLPPIHAAPMPPPGVIRPFAPYRQQNYEPPPWARRPTVWRRAIEIFHGPVPAEPAVFIHRDFHPGNVLVRRGRVTGVVDWQAASIGPATVDVGHCRANLLRYGLAVADRFTDLWQRASGLRHHPWADVVTIIGFLDGLCADPPTNKYVIEDTLARAVGELHGT